MFKNALNATLTKTDGSRVNLRGGDGVTYENLPNQPIAVVVYNNSGDSTEFRVAVGSDKPMSFTAESVQQSGLSLGFSVIFDPSKGGITDVTVTVPTSAASGASLDVYLVSLYLPTGPAVINKNIPLDGTIVDFGGYCRTYCTPQLAWYERIITATSNGVVCLSFEGSMVNVIAVNTPLSSTALQNFVSVHSSMKDNVQYTSSKGSYKDTFYGESSQMVVSPVSSANTTNAGSISVQQL